MPVILCPARRDTIRYCRSWIEKSRLSTRGTTGIRKSCPTFRCIRRETFRHEICQTRQREVPVRFQTSRVGDCPLPPPSKSFSTRGYIYVFNIKFRDSRRRMERRGNSSSRTVCRQQSRILRRSRHDYVNLLVVASKRVSTWTHSSSKECGNEETYNW